MSLENVRIVLVNPSHPGNIGAAARAMKTMCLHTLHLIAPADYSGPEAWARAAGADDVLAGITCSGSLTEALEGTRLVIGTSARSRTIPWPSLEPDVGARQLVAEAEHGPVALVFGREKMGLTNDELDQCQFVVSIPANARYSSLNLGCAVQVMCYEIMRASQQPRTTAAREWREPHVPLARNEDIDRFYHHLQEVLEEIRFLDPENPRKLMRRLYRLFNRTCLDENEVNILRGILTAVQEHGGR